jgi:DNA-binding NarL/FixJ family response regulator
MRLRAYGLPGDFFTASTLIKNLPRVLVADDHDQMRCLMVELLCKSFQVVGAVADSEELIRSAGCLLPDVIVTDIFLTWLDGLSARYEVISQQPEISFVFVSALGKEVVELVPSDAPVGFVYKAEMLACLIDAVVAVLSGERYLSPHYRD